MGKGRKKGYRKSSLIRTAPMPNKEIMASYQHRAASLLREEGYADQLAAKFHNYGPVMRLNGTTNALATKPKAEVIEALRKLRLDHPLDRCVVLKHTKEVKISMYFGFGADEQAFVLEEDAVHKQLRRSVVYRSRKRAVEQFQRSKLIWVECAAFEEIILSEPSKPSPQG